MLFGNNKQTNRAVTRNIPLTQDQIEHLPDYIDNYDDIVSVTQRKDGSVRIVFGKKINGHTIIVETVSKGRRSIFPITAYQVDTERYEKTYGKKAASRDHNASHSEYTEERGDLTQLANDSIANKIENINAPNNILPQGMGAASASFTGGMSPAEQWVAEA